MNKLILKFSVLTIFQTFKSKHGFSSPSTMNSSVSLEETPRTSKSRLRGVLPKKSTMEDGNWRDDGGCWAMAQFHLAHCSILQ